MSSFANRKLNRGRRWPRYGVRGMAVGLLMGLSACAPLDGDRLRLLDRADTAIATETPPAVSTAETVTTQVLAAELALSRNQPAAASQRYAEAARLSSDPALARRAAELAMRVDEPDRALAMAERWQALDPDSLEAHQILGIMQLEQGAIDQARATLVDGVPEDPKAREAAIGRLGSLLQRQFPDRTAVSVMQSLTAAYPDSPAAQLALARLALQVDELGLAQDAVDQAIALRDDWTPARLLRAELLLAQDRPEAALAQYRRLFEAGERDPRLLNMAAVLAINTEAYALAEAVLEAMREGQPGLGVQSRVLEGDMLRKRGEYAQSLAVLNEGLENHPRSTDLRYARALTRLMLEQIDQAVSELEALVDEQPDEPRLLNALGYTLIDRTDRLDAGAELIERAYALAPDNPAIIDSMGWAAFLQGHPEEALEYLRTAHERALSDPEIAAHLGEVLWVLGRRDQARSVWEAALESQPDHPVLRETQERLDP